MYLLLLVLSSARPSWVTLCYLDLSEALWRRPIGPPLLVPIFLRSVKSNLNNGHHRDHSSRNDSVLYWDSVEVIHKVGGEVRVAKTTRFIGMLLIVSFFV